jgi:D-3-phosphoglycerate dehydrogenase
VNIKKGVMMVAEKKKVLIATRNDRTVELIKGLILKEYPDAEFEVALGTPVSEEEMIEKGQGAEAIVCGLQPITEKVYASLPGLRAVVYPSVGYDTTDPAVAAKYGVIVTNVPDYCLDEVSSHAVTLMLHMQRGLYKLIDYVKAGNWGIAPIMPRQRFSGLTVGFYGLGSIGREVAKKLSGFDVNMICNDPYLKEEAAAALNVKLVSFDELLAQSDFITLHAPLFPSTRGIFNEEAFKKMKPTAYIVNCARGPIIDTESLYKALTEGWIAGAALDVLEHEPPHDSDRKIIGLPNVIVTPHSAFYSVEAMEEQQLKAANEVGRALRGERPRICVNKAVLEKITWFVD